MIGGGLLASLEVFMAAHPACRLVVIDTLQKVRDARSASAGVYAADYSDLGALKAFADRNGVCLVAVHHLRKMSDDTDPFNRIAGTTGILGAADTAIVLARARREDAETTLHLTGRDVEEQDIRMRFDKRRCRWEVLEEADGYEADPLVRTIRRALDEEGGSWRTNAKGLKARCVELCGHCPEATPRELAGRLAALAPLLAERDGIRYHEYRRSNSGRAYLFCRADGAGAPDAPGEQLALTDPPPDDEDAPPPDDDGPDIPPQPDDEGAAPG